jgi:steroid delta-isomerase-like uncharacterized protein
MEQIAEMAKPVQKLYEALNQQKIEAFDQIISDEVEFIDYALDETIRGKEAFKNYFKNWWTAFPTGTGSIQNMIVSNEQVVVEAMGQGTQSGLFKTSQRTIEPAHRAFVFHFCQVFQVQNGKIVKGQCYSDAFKLFTAGATTQVAA